MRQIWGKIDCAWQFYATLTGKKFETKQIALNNFSSAKPHPELTVNPTVNNCFTIRKMYQSEFFLSKTNVFLFKKCAILPMRNCRVRSVLYTRQSGIKLSRTVYFASYLPQIFYPSKWRVYLFFYPSDSKSTRKWRIDGF